MTANKLAFRIDEAVDATGIGRTKLYELIRDGELDVIRVGRRTLIPVRSLEALLARLDKSGSST